MRHAWLVIAFGLASTGLTNASAQVVSPYRSDLFEDPARCQEIAAYVENDLGQRASHLRATISASQSYIDRLSRVADEVDAGNFWLSEAGLTLSAGIFASETVLNLITLGSPIGRIREAAVIGMATSANFRICLDEGGPATGCGHTAFKETGQSAAGLIHPAVAAVNALILQFERMETLAEAQAARGELSAAIRRLNSAIEAQFLDKADLATFEQLQADLASGCSQGNETGAEDSTSRLDLDAELDAIFADAEADFEADRRARSARTRYQAPHVNARSARIRMAQTRGDVRLAQERRSTEFAVGAAALAQANTVSGVGAYSSAGANLPGSSARCRQVQQQINEINRALNQLRRDMANPAYTTLPQHHQAAQAYQAQLQANQTWFKQNCL